MPPTETQTSSTTTTTKTHTGEKRETNCEEGKLLEWQQPSLAEHPDDVVPAPALRANHQEFCLLIIIIKKEDDHFTTLLNTAAAKMTVYWLCSWSKQSHKIANWWLRAAALQSHWLGSRGSPGKVGNIFISRLFHWLEASPMRKWFCWHTLHR